MRLKIIMVLMALAFTLQAQEANGNGNRTVYVSAAGNDANLGTEHAPVRSLKRAIRMNPKAIVLRRGDVFYENINIDGIDVSSYGSGDLPTLSGLRDLNNKAWQRGEIKDGKWRKARKGKVWRINLADEASTKGGYASIRKHSQLNNIGGIVNLDDGQLTGCMRVPYGDQLHQNYDFWQDVREYTNGYNVDSLSYLFDYLYVYYDGDIRRLNLGVTVGASGIYAQNCEIRDISVSNWGWHGINGGSNLRIIGCHIDNIGGRMMSIRNDGSIECLGNGIEFYIKPPGKHDSLVQGCIIKHCFDCGLTIQGLSEEKITATNIVFTGNEIYNCCQSYEEFLRGGTANSLFHNCVFRDNYSQDAGIDTGFRYADKRYKRCHILGNSFLRRTGMIYANNTFRNGNYYCDSPVDGLFNQSVWDGNVCHIYRGQHLLGDYNGKKVTIEIPIEKGEYSTIEEATEVAIKKYRELTGDNTTKFVVIEK